MDNRTFVGVYTCHNCLNRHLSVLGLINNSKCSNCNEADGTALHYLCYCSHYGAVITRICGKHFLHPSKVTHITVKDLLRFLTSSWRFHSTLVRNTRGSAGGWTMGLVLWRSIFASTETSTSSTGRFAKNSASEVTTLWHYTNLFIIIIVINSALVG